MQSKDLVLILINNRFLCEWIVVTTLLVLNITWQQNSSCSRTCLFTKRRCPTYPVNCFIDQIESFCVERIIVRQSSWNYLWHRSYNFSFNPPWWIVFYPLSQYNCYIVVSENLAIQVTDVWLLTSCTQFFKHLLDRSFLLKSRSWLNIELSRLMKWFSSFSPFFLEEPSSVPITFQGQLITIITSFLGYSILL